ncbi:MAG: PAS domain S-box protein [Geminicoccaceae bacterium]
MAQELDHSAERFRDLIEGAIHGIHVHRRGKPLFANQMLAEIFGYDSPKDILALDSIMELAAPHERNRLWQIAGARARGEDVPSHYEYQGQRRDGSVIWLDNVVRTLVWDGEPAVQASVIDITKRKEVDGALRREQRFNSAILDTIDSLVVVLDRKGRILLFNHACEAATGYRADELEQRSIWDVLIPQESVESVKQVFDKLSAGSLPSEYENAWLRKDGSECHISWSNTATLNDQGDVELVIGTGTDVTEQRALQRQLLQAQKMEAIGQLTGGVAHDFNNLLTAILGNLEMLEMWHGGDERSGKAISQAQEAANLGAELTGRLLAFARRQPLDPKAISLSEIVLDMSDLLSRTLGETIEINTVLANPLNDALVDPSQLQNALLNLAINARDAMPDGGRLTIETANVELDEDYAREDAEVNAGNYVLLSVADTGIGMTPEIRDRVFEPFFTTKDAGKGSGLGLSMIYGFAKQSGGHIRIYSESGQGTTVNLYFPEAGTHDEAMKTPSAEEAMPEAHGEVVLVVEDEPRVRHVTVQRLETLGYSVLEAENGPAALAVLATSPDVDLVFTDMVMPGGMSGSDLATAIRERSPQIKVMLTSGYAEQAGIEKDAFEEGEVWLRKPYRLIELASKIREVLDS